MPPTELSFTFTATPTRGEVPALLLHPERAYALLVLAHGAGAGMEHPFMTAFAESVAARGVATFRYAFPYAHAGSRRPDPAPVLEATVAAAVAAAARAAPRLPLFAGGRSMGGRMTSRAVAAGGVEGVGGVVRGLVFLGFPLHAAGRAPGAERAEHLAAVGVPMLFLQGTRDALADPELMRGVCARLGERATLHEVEGADHGFHVPKRSGRSDDEVIEELAGTAAAWMRRHAVVDSTAAQD